MIKCTACMAALAMLFCLLFSGSALAEDNRISVVTTIFPIYDWAREIVGDEENVEVTMLLDNGVDLHSYQPTASDIMKVATCDVFVYVGGESDEWVEDALKEAVNPDMVVVSLMELMGDDAKAEEIVEGMEHDHDHGDEDHDHEDEEHDHEDEEHGHEDEEHDHEEHEHEHEEELDEHVWLSLRNAQKLVTGLSAALGEADPAHADAYAANAEAYAGRLAQLDERYAAVRESADFDTILFGDRFPFRYLADDYGLTYYAAFSGCSAETEASFETIVFLAGKVDELGLHTVLTIEGDNHRIAQTIVDNSRDKDAQVLALDSLQSTTGQDAGNGVTYLSVMEDNLAVLEAALTR